MFEKLRNILFGPQPAPNPPPSVSDIPITHASEIFTEAFEKIRFLLEDNYQKTCILDGNENKFHIAKNQGFMIKALERPNHPHTPTVNESKRTVTFCSDNTLFANKSIDYLKESGLTPYIYHDLLPLNNTSIITIHHLDLERLEALFIRRNTELSAPEPSQTRGHFVEAELLRQKQRSEPSRSMS